jgi:hypothetical protein
MKYTLVAALALSFAVPALAQQAARRQPLSGQRADFRRPDGVAGFPRLAAAPVPMKCRAPFRRKKKKR